MAGKIPAILLAVILTGGVVAGGMYLLQKNQPNPLAQENQTLQKQVVDLKQESAEKNVACNHVAVRGEAVLNAWKQGDYEKLSTYVHPDKGVRFTPYAHVDVNKDKKFTASQIKGMKSNTTVYEWGVNDGSGTPIKLTFADYTKKFVYDQDYLQAKAVSFNSPIGKGNTENNAAQVYPGATIIEYHFPGFEPKYEGMDWKSLRLVFEQKDGVWYLIGVIHDQWTI